MHLEVGRIQNWQNREFQEQIFRRASRLFLFYSIENLLAGVPVFFLVFDSDGLVDEGLCFRELPLFHENPGKVVQQIGVVAFDSEALPQRGFRLIDSDVYFYG